MMNWQSLVNSASELVIAGYLATVIYQTAAGGDNVVALFKGAVEDYQFLEFLIAGAILNVIVQIPATHDVVIVLIFAAVLAIVLKFFEETGNLGAIQDFGAGKSGLFDTITKLFTGG